MVGSANVLGSRLGLLTLTGVFFLSGVMFVFVPLVMQEKEHQMTEQLRAELLELMREVSMDQASAVSDMLLHLQVATAPVASSNCPKTPSHHKEEVQKPNHTRQFYYNNWNDWLWSDEAHDHLAADHLPVEGLAPLTREVQRLIYEHQHPSDCKSAKFLIDGGWIGGVGSDMHVASARLGHAITTGAIYIFRGDSDIEWTDDNICPGNQRGFQNCFFRPVTNCTLDDIAPDRSYVHNTAVPFPVPERFAEMLRSRFDMQDDEIKYWWRAQSVTYLFRFSPRTLSLLRSLRRDKSLHRVISNNEPWAKHILEQPYMPPGVVSAHVRHGDKVTEMELQPWNSYIQTAEAMVRNMPNALHRVMFLSTEDLQVVEDAKNNHPNEWVIVYSEIPRIDTSASSDISPEAMVRQMGHGHEGNITLTHFSQLLMALEADAWVGTRGSNWNRLIDELRCTLVPKCKNTFIEVGSDFESYGW